MEKLPIYFFPNQIWNFEQIAELSPFATAKNTTED